MTRYWTFRIWVVLIVFAAAGHRFADAATNDATAAPLPKDPCALLKPADIQALAPNAKIGSGVLTTNAPLGASCAYKWGPRTSEWGETSLTITMVDTAAAWPGLSSDVIKRRVTAEVKAGGPDASEVPGIGDGALFTTAPKSYNATAKAYLVKAKGVLLEVTFHGTNALAQKDKLIALLKAAAAAI